MNERKKGMCNVKIITNERKNKMYDIQEIQREVNRKIGIERKKLEQTEKTKNS